jgi:hypothetical protein
MKKKFVIELDLETKKIIVTDYDGETFTATGMLLLLGNNPSEGTCLSSSYGDCRAMAEAFACLSGDENPRSQRVIAHIKERMHRKHITADEALKKFEGEACQCVGDAGCVCGNRKIFH